MLSIARNYLEYYFELEKAMRGYFIKRIMIIIAFLIISPLFGVMAALKASFYIICVLVFLGLVAAFIWEFTKVYNNGYVKLAGECVESSINPMSLVTNKRTTNTIMIDCEGVAYRMIDRTKKIKEGNLVTVYLPADFKAYEKDGAYTIERVYLIEINSALTK